MELGGAAGSPRKLSHLRWWRSHVPDDSFRRNNPRFRLFGDERLQVAKQTAEETTEVFTKDEKSSVRVENRRRMTRPDVSADVSADFIGCRFGATPPPRPCRV